jgi:hypothetical protein
MRPLVGAVLVVLVAAACGGGKAKRVAPPTPRVTHAATVQKAAPQKIHVTLTAQSHAPRVGKPWHYAVRVTDAAGKPVRARVHTQIVFGGAPVGQIGTHTVTGVWQETIGKDGNQPFPKQARGYPLIFQAVVTAKGVTVKRNWPIRVR